MRKGLGSVYTQLRSSLKIFKASHYPYDILKLFWIVQFLSQLQRMCLHCLCVKQTFYKPRKIKRGKRLHLICPPSWDACSLNCDRLLNEIYATTILWKRTNNDLQNIHKTKYRVTRTPLKTRSELVTQVMVATLKFLHLITLW
jgi:hypothetical protein